MPANRTAKPRARNRPETAPTLDEILSALATGASSPRVRAWASGLLCEGEQASGAQPQPADATNAKAVDE